ncbi:hypothetical protein R9X47_17510 [Wukongibacter baidiensis]|uniref:hypothetical protein n=1 Tax=Wukongibacter baidiensis TaxID=1723361 RepID=UPI003D7F74C0
MDKKDTYYSFEDNRDTNLGMGMNPYMGMYMHPMMSMMPMGYHNLMPNLAMHQVMNMNPMNMHMMSMQSMMPMDPMMMRIDMDPITLDDNIDDEDYMNYMINMNKYMAYTYEAEAYRLKAMEYMNKIEK